MADVNPEARELADLLSAALTDTETLNARIRGREQFARNKGHLEMIQALRDEATRMLKDNNMTLYPVYVQAADFLQHGLLNGTLGLPEELP